MLNIPIPRAREDVTIDELVSFLSGVKAEHGNIYVNYELDNGLRVSFCSAHIDLESLGSRCNPTLMLY